MTGAAEESLVVRVLPEGTIDKTFDYLVPDALRDQVRVGTRVRVSLHGRRVGGWVVRVGVDPPPGVVLKPIAKVTGWGPSAEVVKVAAWAAWRWAGRPASLLSTASPEMAVRGLPRPFSAASGTPQVLQAAENRLVVVRRPPAADAFDVVLAAADLPGDALVVAPSVAAASSLASRLRASGRPVALLPRDWAAAAAGGRTVVGARAAAWGPAPDLGAVVVLDVHDEAHQQEQAPTWSAWMVAAERARLAGAPCWLVSPVPPLEALALPGAVLDEPSRAAEREGWAVLDVVDQRAADPLAGRWSEELARMLRAPGPVVCVLNRTGRARLLVCRACGTVAACEVCGSALREPAAGLASDPQLECPSAGCGAVRPAVCASCGSGRFKGLRQGVTRVREELEALARRPVAVVTGAGPAGDPRASVLVGTEAVLHRVPEAWGALAGVAFLEFDQELLRPQYRAGEEALGLLARASRLVGGRPGGRVLVQTRSPDHPVVTAALHADPSAFFAGELAVRTALGYPPAAALALVSGEPAAEFVAGVAGIEVRGPDASGRYLLRAPDHARLCNALAAAPRPAGRLRIEVDPLRF